LLTIDCSATSAPSCAEQFVFLRYSYIQYTYNSRCFNKEKTFFISQLSRMTTSVHDFSACSRTDTSLKYLNLCVPEHCLAGRCKNQGTLQARERDHFGSFLGLKRWNFNSLFTVEAGKPRSNWQHRLRLANLLSQHNSWRHHYVTTSKECLTNSQTVFK